MNLKNRLGTRAFYRMVLSLALPMMIQNAVSNLVSLLDNLMIGRLGTNAISGVAVSNQLIFVFYLLIFGASAGVGIFSAQFYGNGDIKGVRDSFRFKLIANTVLSVMSIIVFLLFTPFLISLFLQGEGTPEDAAEILRIGRSYMHIMLIGLIPVGITNSYAGTLRDTGETKIPMVASLIAIAVNLSGNAILIYGLLGFPALGADGAAIATVFSRFVEMGFLIIYTQTHSEKHTFIKGAFRHFTIPASLAGKFTLKSLPLMANETLWSLGTVIMNQCYSFRSMAAVPALSIESTLWNLLGVAFIAMGEAVGIVVGQKLGGGEIEAARDSAEKMRDFTVLFGLVFGLILAVASPFFPFLYDTTDNVRKMASGLILVYAVLMPFHAYTHASYFIIRAGGNTLITFLFDSCFVWVISVPMAFCLSRFTGMGVVMMVAAVQSVELIKCIIGGSLVKSGIWARNLARR